MLLRDKDKVRIIDLAKTIFSKAFIILAYGSRVSGEAHDASDLDLAILNSNNSDDKIDSKELMKYRTALAQSNIPILVDVFLFDSLPKSFQDNINDCNEILYKSESS